LEASQLGNLPSAEWIFLKSIQIFYFLKWKQIIFNIGQESNLLSNPMVFNRCSCTHSYILDPLLAELDSFDKNSLDCCRFYKEEYFCLSLYVGACKPVITFVSNHPKGDKDGVDRHLLDMQNLRVLI